MQSACAQSGHMGGRVAFKRRRATYVDADCKKAVERLFDTIRARRSTRGERTIRPVRLLFSSHCDEGGAGVGGVGG